MASNERYVQATADIKVSRSRFPLNRRTLMSYFHGYLHPVGAPIEVLPGDTFKLDISAFTRMSTPIVPFMDDIRQEIDAFFVPKRILWNKTKQFYGESETAGVATKVYEPYGDFAVALSSLTTNLLKSESYAAAFGLVYDDATGNVPAMINVLPIRAMISVWNSYFRDENYERDILWDKDQSGLVTTLAYHGAVTVTPGSNIPRVNKDHDLFTSILPYIVKSNSPVFVGGSGDVGVQPPGIGDFLKASVELKPTVPEDDPDNNQLGYFGLHFSNDGNTKSASFVSTGDEDDMWNSNSVSRNMATSIRPDGRFQTNLIAKNVNIAITDLLYALAYQDFLAKSAKFGTRYREYIFSMFGTTIADASEDIPEYLGRLKFRINVNQVVQTTGFDPSSSSELGQLGAYSNSGRSGHMFTKSFTEPGYVVLVTYTKHQRTYSSGVDRIFLKKELLDYYQPPFANIADVPIGSHSLYLDKDGETALGFQEPWWDYRSLQDRSYGLMNPKIDTLGQIWTLGDLYSTKPSISSTFMKEDRAELARCLVTGSNGPDYLMDFRVEIDATRVMPLFPSGRLGSF